MKRSILIFSLATLLFAGCKPDVNNTPPTAFLRSYVMSFYEMKGIKLTVYPYNEIPDNYEIPANTGFDVIGIDIIKDQTVASYLDPDPTLYNALCEDNDDMSFNRTVALPVDGSVVEYPECGLVDIDITCSREFAIAGGATYAAGTSLKNVVTLRYYSAKDYVELASGDRYGKYGDGVGIIRHGLHHYYYLEKPLADVTAEELELLGSGVMGYDNCLGWGHGCGCGECPEPSVNNPNPPHNVVHDIDRLGRMIFNAPPVDPGDYEFTITLTDEDGLTYNATITMTN